MKLLIGMAQSSCLFLVALCTNGIAHADGLLVVDNPAGIDEATRFYVVADGFQGSDALSIRQFMGNWQGSFAPREGSNIGILAARSEVGMQSSGFRIGAIYRSQALAETNRDTADLVRQYNTNAGYSSGRTYSMDYRLRAFTARGIRLSKSLGINTGNYWQVHFGVAGSMLSGTQLKIETATGQATALNSQDFSADTAIDSKNSALETSDLSSFNPFVLPQSFSGNGYALDAGMVFRRDDGFQVEIALNDLVGQIDWRGVPQRVTNYNTATKYYDASGYVRFNPSATAVSSYVSYMQVLDPKLWLGVSYPVGNYGVQFATSYQAEVWLPEANLSWAISPNLRFKTGYDLRFGSILISLQHPLLQLSLRTDNLDLGQAKGYGIRIGMTLPI